MRCIIICDLNKNLLKNTLKTILMFTLMFFLGCTHFGDSEEYLPSSLKYFFDDLHMKNFDQMEDLLRPTIQQATSLKEGKPSWVEFSEDISKKEYIAYFQTVLLVTLSRPPRNNVVQRLVRKIKRQYNLSDEFYPMVKNITQRALTHIKNPRRSPIERATYFYILENIIQEVRPFAGVHPQVTEILNLIYRAQITIPDSVHRERYIKALEPKKLSPSELAYQLIRKFKLPEEEK